MSTRKLDTEALADVIEKAHRGIVTGDADRAILTLVGRIEDITRARIAQARDTRKHILTFAAEAEGDSL